MKLRSSRHLRIESLESRLVLSATFQDAGINQQAIDAINNSQYASDILADATLQNTLDAIAASQTAPVGAMLITSEAQFSQITSGSVQNPNEYLIQGNLTVTGTFEVPSNVHIYVDGSIFKQGTFTAPGGVHSVENGSDAIFKLSGSDNVKLIGIDNALLHSNPNLQASAPHTTAIYIGNGSDNVEVDGFEIANVWEGVVARSGGLDIDDVTITNNYIRNTVGRAIWSLGSNNTEAAHNFIENAGVDGLDWDAFTNAAVGYENVVVGAGRWAGFVEEAAHDSYFIRSLSLIVDLNNPNRGYMLGWADNGTTLQVVQNSGQQTRNNYFIDNVVFDPGNIPQSGGDYFAKANTGGKGPTYFWANRGFGAGQSTNNFDNAEWLNFVPTAGGAGNSVNGVQLLADLDAKYNPASPGAGNVLFVRGSAGSGGFLEGGSDEQLADITNYQTFGGNHGWGTLADTLTTAGYTLEQVIEGSTPDESGAPVPLSTMNLEEYNLIVFGSNNAVYSQADVNAFEQYILAGGSALFISDANFGSDWADAPNSDQQFLDLIGVEVHQDQGTYVVGDLPGEIFAPNHPIFAGVEASDIVTQFDGEGVSPFHIKQSVPGATVTLLAGAEGQTRLNGGSNQGPSRDTNSGDASAFSATYGAGRIAGHFDRNTFFNINGAGTNITRYDNQQYALNLFNWLATTPPIVTPGDFDGNGFVDAVDLAQWQGDVGLNGNSDADGDYDSDGADFLAWQRNYHPEPPQTETVVVVLDTDYTGAEGYSSGNLTSQPGWLGQNIAQVNSSGSGTVASVGGPWDRNMYGNGATGGANGSPSSTGFDADDKLRVTFDYQFTLSSDVNTSMANVGFRNEGPLASNGWDAKPLQGFQLEFSTSQPANGGTVKIFPDLADSNDADALLLDGLDLGINPGGGDFTSDHLQITYEASTNGAGTWTVDSLSVENLDTTNVYTYAGPVQAFNYSASDAFFAQQLATNGDLSFSGMTDGVRFEYVTLVPAGAGFVSTLAAPLAVDTQELLWAAQALAAQSIAIVEDQTVFAEAKVMPVASASAVIVIQATGFISVDSESLVQSETEEDALDEAFAKLDLGILTATPL